MRESERIIARMSEERDRHGRALREILGLPYPETEPEYHWVEGLLGLVDYMRCMSCLGQHKLKHLGLLLGAKALDESRKED